jgi:Kef-type K+ transport system membrane component KefB
MDGDNPFRVLVLDFVHNESPMSVAMGRTTTEQASTTGSDMRRWVCAGLMLAGGAATLIGIGLPWGHAGATTLTGLSPSVSVFALALVAVGLIGILSGVLRLRGLSASWQAKSVALAGMVGGIAVWVILPAGIIIATQQQAGVLTTSVAQVTFGFGSWVVAGGVTAFIVGTMLLCTKSRRRTLAAMFVPVAIAALMIVELQ